MISRRPAGRRHRSQKYQHDRDAGGPRRRRSGAQREQGKSSFVKWRTSSTTFPASSRPSASRCGTRFSNRFPRSTARSSSSSSATTGVLKDNANQLLARIGNVPGGSRLHRPGRRPAPVPPGNRPRPAARYGLNVMDAGRHRDGAGRQGRHRPVGGRPPFQRRGSPKESERALDRLGTSRSGLPAPDSPGRPGRFQAQQRRDEHRPGISRVVAIGVFIRDRDMGSVVADMQKEAKGD